MCDNTIMITIMIHKYIGKIIHPHDIVDLFSSLELEPNSVVAAAALPGDLLADPLGALAAHCLRGRPRLGDRSALLLRHILAHLVGDARNSVLERLGALLLVLIGDNLVDAVVTLLTGDGAAGLARLVGARQVDEVGGADGAGLAGAAYGARLVPALNLRLVPALLHAVDDVAHASGHVPALPDLGRLAGLLAGLGHAVLNLLFQALGVHGLGADVLGHLVAVGFGHVVDDGHADNLAVVDPLGVHLLLVLESTDLNRQ